MPVSRSVRPPTWTGATWQQYLAALYEDGLDGTSRAAILALGAARLAVNRALQGQVPTTQDVISVAFREFALPLDADEARQALQEISRTDG
ncbi:hypothetical protein RKD23_007794 [Streptomyces sp. SAI-170]|uniref:hypothetical protein n=1 Tax=Streptomyces sp. SAI-170 TaxID=3377729 RepID=UPI003C7D892D